MTGPAPACGVPRERVLGAVLAGGLSSRFGRDKALALHDGLPLIAHALAALAPCSAVVIVGRDRVPAGVPVPRAFLPDWPGPAMGPLGGLAAALRYAEAEGFASVLAVPVDTILDGVDLLAELGAAPACAASQPVIGHWPARAGAAAVAAILAGSGRHSLRALAGALDARLVALSRMPANINTPADLAGLRR